MNFAEERQHVVLAQTEHLDVFHDHHLVVGDGEEGVLEHRLWVFVIATREKLECLVHPSRRAQQTFALGIFIETDEHFSHQLFEGGAG